MGTSSIALAIITGTVVLVFVISFTGAFLTIKFGPKRGEKILVSTIAACVITTLGILWLFRY